MDYQKHYNKLILQSKDRELQGYYEKHHIVPRCLGGSDDKNNLVNLTPEEHYVAHQLLVKIYPNNVKILNAAVMMIPNRPSNKLYGWLRRKFSDLRKIQQSGSSNSQFGTRWIHNNLVKKSKKIGKKDILPIGWNEGRKINFDIKFINCKFCNKEFERLCLEVYCSETCKRHDKSEAIRIIDANLSEMLDYYPTVRSIDKTLIYFGIKGHRAGNKYFSEILKEQNIYVRPRTIKN